MKIDVIEQIGEEIVKTEIPVFDEDGNEIGTETVEKVVPKYGRVIRDMTPEEEAEHERMMAEMPMPETQPEIVNISREDFNLLDATQTNTIYYITEENGTITMIRGENR